MKRHDESKPRNEAFDIDGMVPLKNEASFFISRGQKGIPTLFSMFLGWLHFVTLPHGFTPLGWVSFRGFGRQRLRHDALYTDSFSEAAIWRIWGQI